MEITQELKDLVIAEATKLKTLLSHEEINNLNIETFDPTLPHGCVYGQVSGECHSIRAKHLLNKAAVPHTSNIEKYIPTTDTNFHDRKLFKVGNHDVYSAMEFLLFNNVESRSKVLDFLKNKKENNLEL